MSVDNPKAYGELMNMRSGILRTDDMKEETVNRSLSLGDFRLFMESMAPRVLEEMRGTKFYEESVKRIKEIFMSNISNFTVTSLKEDAPDYIINDPTILEAIYQEIKEEGKLNEFISAWRLHPNVTGYLKKRSLEDRVTAHWYGRIRS